MNRRDFLKTSSLAIMLAGLAGKAENIMSEDNTLKQTKRMEHRNLGGLNVSAIGLDVCLWSAITAENTTKTK